MLFSPRTQDRFIGVDVGSVTTKLVVIDGTGHVLLEEYIRNNGSPIEAVQDAFGRLASSGLDGNLAGIGTTGSGRFLAAAIVGAGVIKNEISCHARAAREAYPDVGTVIDIGGQDSKIIFFKDGYPVGFNMNTICAAGTGSFLDHQASRLGIPIEEFGEWALRSRSPARIAGRCGVFAESDLIHKQQLGYRKEDLIAGLCEALATNYVVNVARGHPIRSLVLFQGGVAANKGMKKALEDKIGLDIIVPPHFKVMGALGAALYAAEASSSGVVYRGRCGKDSKLPVKETASRISSFSASSKGFICGGCANSCEIQEISVNGKIVARWGSKCGKWEVT
ncbi:MAG TPA: 2-hydroxyglutaryl-CoA dehydratase [Firmicutes bacterium]|nr:2-hydroxyglutaryl-CoA dehydratase [Candidatus Fermentithermobacillaceae bacterium]